MGLPLSINGDGVVAEEDVDAFVEEEESETLLVLAVIVV